MISTAYGYGIKILEIKGFFFRAVIIPVGHYIVIYNVNIYIRQIR